MFMFPQNSRGDILIPKGDDINRILIGGAFRRWLGHEGGALMNGICALIEQIPHSFLAPFCHVRT